MIAGALGLAFAAGTGGAVQAGLLDALFGGSRGYQQSYDAPAYGQSAPRYYDEDVPRSGRRSREDRQNRSDTTMEVAPLLQSSTCCKNGEDPMRAIFNDDTLVRGDVVMMRDGLRTFVGSRAPHSPRDFQPVGKSISISATRRKELLALDR